MTAAAVVSEYEDCNPALPFEEIGHPNDRIVLYRWQLEAGSRKLEKEANRAIRKAYTQGLNEAEKPGLKTLVPVVAGSASLGFAVGIVVSRLL